jgi:hypothetical protein
MRPNSKIHIPHMRASLKLLVALLVLTAVSSVEATNNYTGIVNGDGSINVGSDSLFTVLTAGQFNDTNNTFTGPSMITGNVGIGGHGNYSMSDGNLNGDIYMNSYGSFSISGPATISGHRKGRPSNWSSNGFDGIAQDTTLSNALGDTTALSISAGMLTGTSNYTVTQGSFMQGGNINISNPSSNVTISGAGATSPIVLSINTINLSNGTFTLAGTATTTFILNVTGAFTINNSNIFLTGGLLASHVLFNLEGSANTQFNMQQGTTATGTFIAPNRNVDLSGGKIYGRLVTNQLTITSGGQVVSQ